MNLQMPRFDKVFEIDQKNILGNHVVRKGIITFDYSTDGT